MIISSEILNHAATSNSKDFSKKIRCKNQNFKPLLSLIKDQHNCLARVEAVWREFCDNLNVLLEVVVAIGKLMGDKAVELDRL